MISGSSVMHARRDAPCPGPQLHPRRGRRPLLRLAPVLGVLACGRINYDWIEIEPRDGAVVADAAGRDAFGAAPPDGPPAVDVVQPDQTIGDLRLVDTQPDAGLDTAPDIIQPAPCTEPFSAPAPVVFPS